MIVRLVYFSPNGTTLKSLRNIAQGMGDVEIVEYNLLLPENRKKTYSFDSNDLVILGCATAGMIFGKVDEIFNCIEGNNTPLVGVVLYGNGYYGASLIQMKKKAEKRGFRVSALAAFIGQHAINKNVAANRPDAKDISIQLDFGKAIYDKIIINKDYTLSRKPKSGWSGIPKYNVIVAVRYFMQNKEYVLPDFFKTKEVSDDCVRCKRCEANCPVNAINITDKKFLLSACIGCCSCINNCPQKAIKPANNIMNKVMSGFAKDFQKRKEPEIIM